jgi:hypothetical protein
LLRRRGLAGEAVELVLSKYSVCPMKANVFSTGLGVNGLFPSPGVSADLRFYPETGYSVIVLSNQSTVAGPVSDWINKMIAGAM